MQDRFCWPECGVELENLVSEVDVMTSPTEIAILGHLLTYWRIMVDQSVIWVKPRLYSDSGRRDL